MHNRDKPRYDKYVMLMIKYDIHKRGIMQLNPLMSQRRPTLMTLLLSGRAPLVLKATPE